MKIRKTVGRSPMPNQRIANGIQAKGERLRKKLITGRNAVRAREWWPNQSPAGIPANTARAKPVVTRNRDATTSSKSRPFRTSSTKPFATDAGDGKTDSGNNLKYETPAHSSNAASTTTNGRNRALEVIFSSVMVSLGERVQ